MHLSHILTSCVFTFLPLTTCHELQYPLISNQPRLRNATLEDADDLASIVIAVFSPTPAWQYIYQFHKTNPKELHRCVRSGIIQVLTSPDYYVEVIEAPDDANGELSIAAAAAWRPNFTMDDEEDGMGVFVSRITKQCEHRDMNITRAIPFGHASIIALRKYLAEPFGPTQLYLDMIAVHPDYQLHGAGSRLVSRGVEVGRKEGVNVTLAALPTNEGFYAHIGFYSDLNFTIEGIDGDREFRYDVMAYDFGAEQ